MSLNEVNTHTVIFVGDQLRKLEAEVMGAIEDASSGADGPLAVRNLDVLRQKIEEAHVWANHCLITDQRERQSKGQLIGREPEADADGRHL